MEVLSYLLDLVPAFGAWDRLLHKAAELGHYNIIECFIQRGAVPLPHVLVVSASKGHIKCVELLLDAGADPDTPDALDGAVKGGHEDVVRLLLSKGASGDVDGMSGSITVFGQRSRLFYGRQRKGWARRRGRIGS